MNTLKVHPRIKELYKFFKINGRLVDIEDFDPEILSIFSREVLKKIQEGQDGWQELLPSGISEMIEEKRLFGCSRRK
ncbi:protein of unknown function [Tenacibaculum jejuense]|uniref:Uncharacterized protein n=1 Tax=Tenacibaculum jejuense TaxID=584609 RepID=A0A238U8A6_9FLAO|nr:protein of unknown function [Tenacibaculum jejuense]